MAGNKHPIPTAIVDRPRIAFNIFYSKGENLRAKKIQTQSAKAAALKQDPLCARLLERPGKERLHAPARVPKWSRPSSPEFGSRAFEMLGDLIESSFYRFVVGRLGYASSAMLEQI